MNVYDFDGTIYEGDSTRDFWFFSVRRHPGCLRTLPAAIVFGIGYGLKLVDRDTFKKHLYPFVKAIPDIDAELEIFWKTHEKNLMPWYFKVKEDTDLIMSASPQFVLDPICQKLGVKVIASPVNKYTGQLLGPNNHGQRKVDRFKEAYPDAEIEHFYSDLHTDDPLASISKYPHLIRHGVMREW